MVLERAMNLAHDYLFLGVGITWKACPQLFSLGMLLVAVVLEDEPLFIGAVGLKALGSVML